MCTITVTGDIARFGSRRIASRPLDIGCYTKPGGARRGVARHNFKKRQLSPPLPKNVGSTPGIFVEFCIDVGEFWYIFGERKQTSLSSKTGVRGFVPGKIFEFYITVGDFWYIFGEQNQIFLPPKTGVWSILTVHRKLLEFCVAIVSVHFRERKQTFLPLKRRSGVLSSGKFLHSALLLQ